MKRNKAFTLIELVSVLVILAILALIVTPLVLNIIRKARTAADKRSIDAYGRSIELAIADYLLENGTFPTSIEQLTIEYTGDRVVCTTTQLNSDSSVYLAECTVNSRAVTGYTYGTDKTPTSPTYNAYEVGKTIEYKGESFYVIEDSGTNVSTVKLLKAESLTVAEVNQYGTGHINVNVSSSQGTAYDNNGYGGMQYYSSTTCGYNGTDWVDSGCTTNYAQSEIKYVVDGWAQAKLGTNGYEEARLITIDEISSLGYEWYDNGSAAFWQKTENTPSWVYNENYWYWTMSQYNDSASNVWYMGNNGSPSCNFVYYSFGNSGAVRPVIVISKSVLN